MSARSFFCANISWGNSLIAFANTTVPSGSTRSWYELGCYSLPRIRRYSDYHLPSNGTSMSEYRFPLDLRTDSDRAFNCRRYSRRLERLDSTLDWTLLHSFWSSYSCRRPSSGPWRSSIKYVHSSMMQAVSLYTDYIFDHVGLLYSNFTIRLLPGHEDPSLLVPPLPTFQQESYDWATLPDWGSSCWGWASNLLATIPRTYADQFARFLDDGSDTPPIHGSHGSEHKQEEKELVAWARQ